jgi:hypothetical protein
MRMVNFAFEELTWITGYEVKGVCGKPRYSILHSLGRHVIAYQVGAHVCLACPSVK